MLCLIVLSGCGTSSNDQLPEETDWEPTVHETVNNLDGVAMVVKSDTVSPTGLTVTFENNTDKQCIYGEDYLLEKKKDGEWFQVPVKLESYGFNDIGFDLDPSSVSEWTVDWEWLYGSLTSGEYRIVKDILDFRNPGDYDKYYLADEFTVN